MRSSLLLFVAALLFPACTPRSGVRGGGGSDPAFALDAYCAIASTDGLVDWTGGALVACPGLVLDASDEPADGSVCTVSTIDAGGHAHATTFGGARGAQTLADGRVLVWGWDGSLAIRGAGPSDTLADVALDPWLDASRNRIAFVAPAMGAASLEPGDDRRVVVLDLASGTELEVAADATAASPVIVPGTDDVLYVSSATGTTAIFRATARVAAADPTPDACEGGRTGDPSDPSSECARPDTTGSFVQLTNLTPEIPQTNAPPFGRQHVFVGEGDTLRLVYAALVATDTGGLASEVLALDPRTGDVEDLGPGSFPQRGPSGSVLARTGEASCVAVQYLAPGSTP